jgi:hypothetical protein
MRKWAIPGLAAVLALGFARAGGAEPRDPDWVKKRVDEVKQSDTSDWRKVPWAASLLEARKLSKKEDKPLFLFTLDGNLDTGRC